MHAGLATACAVAFARGCDRPPLFASLLAWRVGPAGAKPKADTRLSHRRGCRIRRALIAHVGAPRSMRVAPRC